jgi:hypothetical protein
MTDTCPVCKNQYKSAKGLGQHFTHSDCNPTLTSTQKELLFGMILGDARIDRNAARAVMVNKKFLEWLDDQLGWFSTGVSVFRTPEEVHEYSGDVIDDSYNVQTQYELRTFGLLPGEWCGQFYNDGKQFPPDTDKLTENEIRLWYACDGTLNRDRVEIGISNYMPQRDRLEDVLSKSGYEASVHDNKKLQILTDDSRAFFERTEPVVGFEHKWPDRYRNA